MPGQQLRYWTNYFALPLCGLCVVMIAFICSTLIYRFIKNTKRYSQLRKTRKRTITPYIKFFNIFCICMFMSVPGVDLTHFILTEITDKPLDDDLYTKIRMIADCLYFASSLLLYILLMVKLYGVFRNTTYQISWRITFVFICMMIIFIVCAIWFELYLAIFQKRWSSCCSCTSNYCLCIIDYR